MNPITLLVTVIFGVIGAGLFMAQMPQAGIGFFVLALLTFFSLKMANNWERFVILRAGKLSSVKGPGLFVIIPIIDSIMPKSGPKFSGHQRYQLIADQWRGPQLLSRRPGPSISTRWSPIWKKPRATTCCS